MQCWYVEHIACSGFGCGIVLHFVYVCGGGMECVLHLCCVVFRRSVIAFIVY